MMCMKMAPLEFITPVLKRTTHCNLPNKAGMTPLMIVVAKPISAVSLGVVTTLLDYHADSMLKTDAGTAFSLAEKVGNDQLLEVMKMVKPLKLAGARGTVRASKCSAPSRIRVQVLEGTLELAVGCVNQTVDPYCVVKLDDKQVATLEVCQKTLNPEWNSNHTFYIHENSRLQIELWDYNLIRSNTFLGHASLLLTLPTDTDDSFAPIDQWLPLSLALPSVSFIAATNPVTTQPTQVLPNFSSEGPAPPAALATAVVHSGKLHVVLTYLKEETQEVNAEEAIKDFESKPRPRLEWHQEVSYSGLPVNTSVTEVGFHFEVGPNSVRGTASLDGRNDFDVHQTTAFFNQYFLGRDHTTLYGEHATLGPVVISLEDVNNTGFRRALVRTKKETIRVVITATKNEAAALRVALPLLSGTKLNSTRSNKMHDTLSQFETRQLVTRYKFGVVYAKKGQSDEQTMLANDDVSPDLQEFLSLLGDKVPLLSWKKYAAGLDTISDATGTHSIYTTFQGIEIMFHVSCFLPNQAVDVQKVERKRHIGNDIVVVIFKEVADAQDAIDLSSFVSHFNHAFIVVTPVGNSFQVVSAYKAGVNPTPPLLPPPDKTTNLPLFSRDANFRQFFLTKLINAERSAMEVADFRAPHVQTRKAMLASIIKECSQK
eukprot:TRINITY_DN845_c1_g1_i2.p1 TRINITY_DN845_c1_g1~~TRINITY_DN845_c1_g1_i2.p1  ORF type:complete len:656 (+),score=181.01 TRINITY_DN845_c1_g1_i2:266-2233(+)